MIETNGLGISATVAALLEQERAAARAKHDPMPLVLALQFYHGDQTDAMSLAKLIADVEPERRDDVVFAFVRQVETPLDEEICAMQMYVGEKFPVLDVQVRPSYGMRAGASTSLSASFDLWSKTLEYFSDAYYAGVIRHHSVFPFEADGCPTSRDWIDRLKRAHGETLLLGKRVTGPVMRCPNYHINGTMVVHNSLWPDRPSLHRCPPTHGWDVFHSQVLLAEANLASRIIENPYGLTGMNESDFWTIGREAAWITSIKDGLHHHWARSKLVAEQSKKRHCVLDCSGQQKG